MKQRNRKIADIWVLKNFRDRSGMRMEGCIMEERCSAWDAECCYAALYSY